MGKQPEQAYAPAQQNTKGNDPRGPLIGAVITAVNAAAYAGKMPACPQHQEQAKDHHAKPNSAQAKQVKMLMRSFRDFVGLNQVNTETVHSDAEADQRYGCTQVRQISAFIGQMV